MGEKVLLLQRVEYNESPVLVSVGDETGFKNIRAWYVVDLGEDMELFEKRRYMVIDSDRNVDFYDSVEVVN